MSFRRSHINTRNHHARTRRPAWQVDHISATVKKASPRPKQKPLPSYSLGSNARNNVSSNVTRHHAVSLSQHDTRKMQMAHNGPILEHSAIASPRQKARSRQFSFDALSLDGDLNRPNTAPTSSSLTAAASFAAAAADNSISAEARAQARRQQMAVEVAVKQERAAQFQVALKRRLAKRVRKQRQEATSQSKTWLSLEAKSKKNAAQWVASDASDESLESTACSNSSSRAPCPLLNHLQNITAQSQKARASLFSRSTTTATTTEAKEPEKVDPKAANDVADDVLKQMATGSSTWEPDLSLHGGMVNKTSIDRQSQAHLVVAVRKAEAQAQRIHAQRYREGVRHKAKLAKQEAEMEALRALQDSRVEESRMANENAREEYETFLKEAEAGVSEMAKSSKSRVEREENVEARYVVALRENLFNKLSNKGLHVPNICSCVLSEGTFFVVVFDCVFVPGCLPYFSHFYFNSLCFSFLVLHLNHSCNCVYYWYLVSSKS